MRVVLLFLTSLLAGVLAFGAWVWFGTNDGPMLIEAPAEEPAPAHSKRRYAPYLVLVPAQTKVEATPPAKPQP